MKSIVFFNNKGGVGKTTLACNLVSYLNQHRQKRVLLVDADPQCNATQAILDEAICEDLYLPNGGSGLETLYSYLKPLEDGEPSIQAAPKPLLGTTNRFGTDLLPGHPKMAVIEDRLSDAWGSVRARDIRGFRITNWSYVLLEQLKDKYDLIVFDVGPSLGALNRSVILACDFIVTPFGCDIFSLLGIRNISEWIRKWEGQYSSAVTEGLQDNAEAFKDFLIIQDVTSRHRFLGYSVQQYVTRKFKTGMRAVKSYDDIMREIPGTVHESMSSFTPQALGEDDLALGHIPYLYSLVPMAQASKAPIHALTSSDGLVGSQYKQVQSYNELMGVLCDRLLRNLERQ